jgi:uncharacterized membrane protein
MLGIVAIRLAHFDALFAPAWITLQEAGPGQRYLPFAQLESWPPFAAAATFALAGRMIGRMPDLRFPTKWVLGLGLFVLVGAVDGEAHRMARYWLAPHGTHALQDLVEAGVLVAIMGGLWLVLIARVAAAAALWHATAGLAGLLALCVLQVLIWPGGYGTMVAITDHGIGSWWLHTAVFMIAPLPMLLLWLARETPGDGIRRVSRDHLQAALFGVALIVVMMLLRREAFAVTHAPPVMDLFPDTARRVSYQTILSVAYALLAFGVYLSAVRTGERAKLYVAYGLYAFTAFKVYLFDLESQHQLYRAVSLLVFAAILFVSSHFASRQQRRQLA